MPTLREVGVLVPADSGSCWGDSLMKRIQSIKQIPDKEELYTGGASTCAGCTAVLGLKLALKALGQKTVVVNSSGCMTLLCILPRSPLKVSWIHNAIENAAPTAAAIKKVLERKKKNMNVLVYAGDGATYDIGFGSLSGSMGKKDRIIYVCYNNEEYGNTGAQWTSATGYGAETKTTPRGKEDLTGTNLFRKNMGKIVAAHGVYSATASVAFPLDYINKLRKIARSKRFGFIDLYSSCTTGWNFNPQDSIEVARNAVLSGYWPLYEIDEKGILALNFKPKKLVPLERFLSGQRRFKGLPAEDLAKLKGKIKERWNELLEHEGKRFV